eukprot:1191209-Prorocentrum_minimum.AAC.1
MSVSSPSSGRRAHVTTTARPIRRRIRRYILTTDQSHVRVEPQLTTGFGCPARRGHNAGGCDSSGAWV